MVDLPLHRAGTGKTAQLTRKHPPRTKPSLSTAYLTGKSLYTRDECGYSLDLQAGEHRLVDPGEKAEERVTAGAGGSRRRWEGCPSSGFGYRGLLANPTPASPLAVPSVWLTRWSPQKDLTRKRKQQKFNPNLSLAVSKTKSPYLFPGGDQWRTVTSAPEMPEVNWAAEEDIYPCPSSLQSTGPTPLTKHI